MRGLRYALAIGALLLGACATTTPASAQNVGAYPNAQLPLTGAERLLSAQANATVDITPAMLEGFLFPGGTLPVLLGGTGVSNITGLIRGNGASPFTPAVAADVYALWAGGCSSSNFLRGDGLCVTPSGAGTVTTTGSPTSGNLTAFSGVTSIAPAVASNVISLWGGTCSSSTYLGGDGNCYAATGSGTVTSISLSLPAWLNVSPGTITTNGTFTITSAIQSQALFLGSPASTSGVLSPRALVASDLPAVPLSSGVTGFLAAANGGSGVAGTLSGMLVANATSPYTTASFSNVTGLWGGGCSSSTYLRGDGNCATPSGSGTLTGLTFTMPTGWSVTGSPCTSGACSIAVTQTAPTTPANGGTGTNNGSFTVSVGGNFVTTGGAVTIAAAGTTAMTLPSTGSFTVGYRSIPIDSQSGATYTTTAADIGKSVYSTNTGGATITIDVSTLAVGDAIVFENCPTCGTMTINVNAGTLYLAGVGTTGARTLPAFGTATAHMNAANQLYIGGQGLN